MRLRLAGAAPQLRAFFRVGASDSSDCERGALALALAQGCNTPVISPRTSLRFRVEFQRFLMALSVLHQGQAGIRSSFPGFQNPLRRPELHIVAPSGRSAKGSAIQNV